VSDPEVPDNPAGWLPTRDDRIVWAVRGERSTFDIGLWRLRHLIRDAHRSDPEPKSLTEAAGALGAKSRDYRAAADQIHGEFSARFDGAGEELSTDGTVRGPSENVVGPELIGEQLVAGVRGGGELATGNEVAYLAEMCGGDPIATQYALDYLYWKMLPPLDEVLGQVAIPLAVGAMETLLRNLVRLTDLLSARSPDAKRRNGGAAMNRGPDVWSEILDELIGVDVAAVLGEQWPALREVVARRDVLLHANGWADPQYRERSVGAPAAVALHGVVRCDQTYVDQAFDVLGALADVMSVAVASRFAPGTDVLADFATPAIYRALEHHQWQTAARLAELGLAGLPDDHRHDHARINWWMARRESGESIDSGSALRDEIDSWSPTISDPRTGLALAALRGDVAGAIAAFSKVVGPSSPAARREVATWPLVEAMCKRSSEFEAVVRRSSAGAGGSGRKKGRGSVSRHRPR